MNLHCSLQKFTQVSELTQNQKLLHFDSLGSTGVRQVNMCAFGEKLFQQDFAMRNTPKTPVTSKEDMGKNRGVIKPRAKSTVLGRERQGAWSMLGRDGSFQSVSGCKFVITGSTLTSPRKVTCALRKPDPSSP